MGLIVGTRGGAVWTEQKIYEATPSSPYDGNDTGVSVSLTGDTIVSGIGSFGGGTRGGLYLPAKQASPGSHRSVPRAGPKNAVGPAHLSLCSKRPQAALPVPMVGATRVSVKP